MSEEIANITYKKDRVLCLEGDENNDLYQVVAGRLIVFVLNGSQVNALAILEKGDFFGELSFFDQRPRSAHVVALDDTTVTKYQTTSVREQFPKWLMLLAQSITNKIRRTDELIAHHRIRRKKSTKSVALSMEEQTHLFQLIKKKAELA